MPSPCFPPTVVVTDARFGDYSDGSGSVSASALLGLECLLSDPAALTPTLAERTLHRAYR